MDKRTIGFAAEQKAKAFLCEKGLFCLCENFSCKMGEIDLIMRDKDYVVFVEVKTRRSKDHGSSLEMVTPRKQSLLRKTALFYLQQNPQLQQHPCRFDVIGFDDGQISWIINAIETV